MLLFLLERQHPAWWSSRLFVVGVSVQLSMLVSAAPFRVHTVSYTTLPTNISTSVPSEVVTALKQQIMESYVKAKHAFITSTTNGGERSSSLYFRSFLGDRDPAGVGR
jgi:hypothetical protein